MVRTSVVGSIYALVVIFDSVVHFGDTRYIQAKTNVFALQRERADFDANELPLEQYPVFRRPIPQLSTYENVRMVKRDVVPAITVGAVKILSTSTSGVVQVGSNVCMELETRVHHIRHFLPPAGGGTPSGASPAGAASAGASPARSAGLYDPSGPSNCAKCSY